MLCEVAELMNAYSVLMFTSSKENQKKRVLLRLRKEKGKVMNQEEFSFL